jgi:hypothetical protein
VLLQVFVSVKCQTALGEQVLLTGSHDSLGSWNIAAAAPMKWTQGHIWKLELELEPSVDKLEYKAVLQQANIQVVWEKGQNHLAVITGSQDVECFHTFNRG